MKNPSPQIRILTDPRSDQNLSDQVFFTSSFPDLFSLKIMKYTAWIKKLENIVFAKSYQIQIFLKIQKNLTLFFSIMIVEATLMDLLMK